MNRNARVCCLRSTVGVFAALLLVSPNATAVTNLEETVHESLEVDPGATLSINNMDGSIRIYGADVSEITVTAVKKAYTPERLRGIAVDIQANAGAVVINTTFPAAPGDWSLKDRSGTVEYTIIAPVTTRVIKCDLVTGEVAVEGLRGGSAKAHLTNGWLFAHNCFAELDLAIENGHLDIGNDWWEQKTFITKGRSVNGGIHALLPPDASLKIDATSTNGHVVSALPADDGSASPIPRPAPSAKISLELGDSDGRHLELTATNGNIKIDKAY